MRELPPEAVGTPPAPWTDAVAFALPLVGVAIRLFVARSSPLPPDHLRLFLLEGVVQDAAAGLAIAVLARAVARLRLPRWIASAAAAVPALVLLAGHAAWAEAIVYFGHPPRREDFEVAFGADLVSRSLDEGALERFTGFVAAGALALALLAFAVRRMPRWPGGMLLVAATAVTALSAAIYVAAPSPTANGVLLALLDLAREPRAVDSQGHGTASPPREPLSTIRALAPARAPGEWLSDVYPLAAMPRPRSAAAPRLPEHLQPNIVFLILEGVRAKEVSCYGGPVPGLTPNLDRLAREGIRVERAFSPGTHTPEAGAAYWYGLFSTPGFILISQNPDAELFGLPEILRANGWRSFLWIHNGDQTFYRRDRFYLRRGFRMFDGRDFPKTDPRTNWGYSDKALARRAVAALDQTREPFAALVLTVSNHHPFQLPGDATSPAPVDGAEERGFYQPGPGYPTVGRHTVPMMKTMHYTDEAVGDFFRLAGTKEWAKRTVFVVSADHGLPIVPVGGLASQHELDELRHRIPLILWSPLLRGGRVIDGPASLADVPTTLLGLLGLNVAAGFAGADFLDPAVDLKARPVPLWDEEADRVTILKDGLAYHGTVVSPGSGSGVKLGEEILVDTTRDPRGFVDLSTGLPARTAELRRIATTYLDVYPWLTLAGRTGIPPELRPRRPGR